MADQSESQVNRLAGHVDAWPVGQVIESRCGNDT